MRNLNLSKAFGATLRKLRKKSGYSQEKLAYLAGLDRTYISLLEISQRSPSLETLYNLSRALEIDLPELSKHIELEIERNKKSNGKD